MEWQTIESAPEQVLVDIWLTCGLKQSLREQLGLPEGWRTTDCIKRDGVWYEADDPENEPFHTHLVTHWMPPPSPPKELP